MIVVYVGLPGSGKSLRMAKIAVDILQRNKKYHKKSGIKRVVYSNIKFAPHIEELYGEYIQYWSDPQLLVKARDVDVVWDEIATYLDSTQWQNVPLELKRWLQQHRKYGIDIYGTTQDFPMIDISMRRLTNAVFLMRKMFGSADKSATRPPVESPWGVILMREVDPDCFTDDKTDYKFIGTDFFFIRKKLCDVYDTTQELTQGEYPPLRHIVRTCIDPECGFRKVVHV